MTVRQKIVELLKDGPKRIDSLSEDLGLKTKAVIEHLKHIAHSHKVQITPALCRKCGFSFEPKQKLRPPGRCPKCKKEGVQSQELFISGDDTTKEEGMKRRQQLGNTRAALPEAQRRTPEGRRLFRELTGGRATEEPVLNLSTHRRSRMNGFLSARIFPSGTAPNQKRP